MFTKTVSNKSSHELAICVQFCLIHCLNVTIVCFTFRMKTNWFFWWNPLCPPFNFICVAPNPQLFSLIWSRHGQNFVGASVCKVIFKHIPQPLRSHNQSFETQGQLLKFSKKKLKKNNWKRSSLPGLRMRDPPLGPPSTLVEIFGTRVCRVTLKIFKKT